MPKELASRIKYRTWPSHAIYCAPSPGHHYLDSNITNWFCHGFDFCVNGIIQNNLICLWHILLNIMFVNLEWFFCAWLILRNNVGFWVSIKVVGWENTLETLKCLATRMLGWLTGHWNSLVYFNVLWKKKIGVI